MNEAAPQAAQSAEEADHAANRETTSRAAKSGFLSEYQVYEPHRVGLPPLVPYISELLRRREFAAELSRSGMRAASTRTFFGQIWLVINPLLLAGVYYVFVNILSKRADGAAFWAHLVAGIFAFYYVSGCITSGAQSVTGGGSLIANMAFPRLLMPFSAVRTAFFRFLPTVPVYLVIHLLTGQSWSWRMLLALYFLACMTMFGAGLGAIFATLQVYFRDTMSFLPYFLRIWLYLSPVIWFAEDVPARLAPLMKFNPLFPILGGWTDLLVRSEIPNPTIWLAAATWAIVTLVVGSLFFMSREREFAVRL
jgi:teichoic acid transport system permease protein